MVLSPSPEWARPYQSPQFWTARPWPSASSRALASARAQPSPKGLPSAP